MSDPRESSTQPNPATDDSVNGLPRPVITKTRWPYPLIWLVPLLALILAGFYAADEYRERGEIIVLSFDDAGGLKIDNSTIAHLGVSIGKLLSMQLSGNQNKVEITVRLEKSAAPFAREGAQFWLVRPQISTGTISGLTTLASGPYIEATPGSGPLEHHFNALKDAPLTLGDGLHLTLHAPRLEHIQEGSIVYYRGVEVGMIESISLSSDSNGIDVRTFVRQRYARLVHANSCFWIEGGADVKGGLLTGVEVKLDSLRSLLAGGVSFATPDNRPGEAGGEPVKPGAEFPLYNEPRKEWYDWSPRIPLPPDDGPPLPHPAALTHMNETPQSETPAE